MRQSESLQTPSVEGTSCGACRRVPAPDEMSLLQVCRECHGKCCVGRTLVSRAERDRITGLTGIDAFRRWSKDMFFLDRGTCQYLKSGRCSVQDVKPFVCQIFPLVPRVVDGELWLYCVSECDAAARLPSGFVENACQLTRRFFADKNLSEYEEYWRENKIGDFDDDRVVLRVRVLDAPRVEVTE